MGKSTTRTPENTRRVGKLLEMLGYIPVAVRANGPPDYPYTFRYLEPEYAGMSSEAFANMVGLRPESLIIEDAMSVEDMDIPRVLTMYSTENYNYKILTARLEGRINRADWVGV
jgi:hypothetical protein